MTPKPVEAIEESPGVYRVGSATIDLHYAKLVIESTERQLVDMTPTAAAAGIKIAEATYAVPAQEATRQAEERTKQERIFNARTAIVCALCGGALLVAALVPGAAWPAAVIASVLGGGEYVTRAIKASREPKQLPPAS